MIALHISIINGSLFLWGESSETSRTRKGARAKAPVHPRDAGAGGIADALERIDANIDAGRRGAHRCIVWIPAADGMPYPSSPALGVEMPAEDDASLRPFIVTALPLDPDDVLDPALRETNEALLGSGVAVGPSIAFCTRVVQLALRIARMQAFLPGLDQHDDVWEARWHPSPGDAEQRELLALAAAMPAVCRCMNDGAPEAPRLQARSVAEGLLARALDRFVRWGSDGDGEPTGKGRPRAHASLHDAWLAALRAEHPRLAWKSDSDVADFHVALERWTRAVRVLRDSPFALCFRIAEPAQTAPRGNGWTVDYLLQPKADPSLLLPVADLWQPGTRTSKLLATHGSGSMEFMLTALGQAAGICPAVAASLSGPDPGGFELDAQGAWTFMSEQAGVLQSAGFPVLLPSWWVGRGPARRLAARVSVSSRSRSSGSGFALDAIVSFNVAASLGGEDLSLAELRALAKLKAPLVNVRGQWTHIDPDEIAAALRALKDGGQGTMHARDALSLALGSATTLAGLEVESVRLSGWLEELASSLARREELAELPQPEGFEGTLRPYQVRGFSWLAFLRVWGLGACLADDMGLGKTVQTLALLLRERQAGEKRPALLLCPTSVINNWRREAEQFTPSLAVMVHHGVDRRKRAAFAEEAGRHALVVSSYGLLQRDVEFLKDIPWSGLILDEAQNIKNPDTKQSKAARAIAADYRIALTGTPVENHVGDLWSIMDLLNPGLLGTRGAFTKTFQRPIQLYGDPEKAARLRTITGPFILRRMKTDRSVISDLPDKIETKEYCTLTREQASLYQAVLDEMQAAIASAENIQRRGLVLATLMKLKQICNHPAQFLKDASPLPKRSGKLARLEELLRDIRDLGERTLVFTQFAEMGEALQKHLRALFGEEVFFLYGGVPRKRRDEMVRSFQSDDHAPRVFILSLKAGGTGLNLTRANHVLHYDRWWNPAVENQATDRAFRIGQKRNVMVHRFVVSGTLEEHIDDLIERKSDIASAVVGAGEQWLTELSNHDLFALLRLGAEAVEEDGDGTA